MQEIESLQNAREELDPIKEELARIDALAKSVGDTITNAFTSALVEGKSLKSLLVDIARSFANIAVKAALKPLGNMITGFVDDLFKGSNSALPPSNPLPKAG